MRYALQVLHVYVAQLQLESVPRHYRPKPRGSVANACRPVTGYASFLDQTHVYYERDEGFQLGQRRPEPCLWREWRRS